MLTSTGLKLLLQLLGFLLSLSGHLVFCPLTNSRQRILGVIFPVKEESLDLGG